MEETIKRIEASIDRKKVQSLCKKILKKCSFRSTADLSNITELASWLYVYGYNDEAIAVCDLLKDLEFTGNYSLWDKADYTMCLKARILREQGQPAEREKLIYKVNEHRHPELYSNSVNWYRDTLNRNINSDSGINTKTGWLLTKFMYAVRYREAGGHPIPDEEFDKDISELIEVLKEVK